MRSITATITLVAMLTCVVRAQQSNESRPQRRALTVEEVRRLTKKIARTDEARIWGEDLAQKEVSYWRSPVSAEPRYGISARPPLTPEQAVQEALERLQKYEARIAEISRLSPKLYDMSPDARTAGISDYAWRTVRFRQLAQETGREAIERCYIQVGGKTGFSWDNLEKALGEFASLWLASVVFVGSMFSIEDIEREVGPLTK